LPASDRALPISVGQPLQPDRQVPLVLLTTTCHLPSTARVAMELHDAGADVALLSPADHPARVMSFLSSRLRYRALRPIHAVQRAIEHLTPDLIIPCDERAVRHLHGLHRITTRPDTRRVIELSLGAASSFETSTTRHDLLMRAREAGVRVPDSMPLASADDLNAWAEEHAFPSVLKADGSWAGLGVRIVRDKADAARSFGAMIRPVRGLLALREMVLEHDLFWLRPWLSRARPAMSVQAYVEGWPANCAVACWQGEVLAGICAESVTTTSSTGPCTVARVIDNPEMIEAARRVVRALGLTGLIGFDFMIEAATGASFMIEMNPRCTPISTVRLGSNRDLMEALLACAAGRPMRERPPVTERDVIVYFPHTWRQDPSSVFLRTGYHDVPWEQPALVRALVRPELRERYWIMRLLRKLWHATRSAPANGSG
jgi:formate-dependent phosphoribosylglycinamide formyltransferase (GAR transformylase)